MTKEKFDINIEDLYCLSLQENKELINLFLEGKDAHVRKKYSRIIPGKFSTARKKEILELYLSLVYGNDIPRTIKEYRESFQVLERYQMSVSTIRRGIEKWSLKSNDNFHREQSYLLKNSNNDIFDAEGTLIINSKESNKIQEINNKKIIYLEENQKSVFLEEGAFLFSKIDLKSVIKMYPIAMDIIIPNSKSHPKESEEGYKMKKLNSKQLIKKLITKIPDNQKLEVINVWNRVSTEYNKIYYFASKNEMDLSIDANYIKSIFPEEINENSNFILFRGDGFEFTTKDEVNAKLSNIFNYVTLQDEDKAYKSTTLLEFEKIVNLEKMATEISSQIETYNDEELNKNLLSVEDILEEELMKFKKIASEVTLKEGLISDEEVLNKEDIVEEFSQNGITDIQSIRARVALLIEQYLEKLSGDDELENIFNDKEIELIRTQYFDNIELKDDEITKEKIDLINNSLK